jgi:hypothetical protein
MNDQHAQNLRLNAISHFRLRSSLSPAAVEVRPRRGGFAGWLMFGALAVAVGWYVVAPTNATEPVISHAAAAAPRGEVEIGPIQFGASASQEAPQGIVEVGPIVFGTPPTEQR